MLQRYFRIAVLLTVTLVALLGYAQMQQAGRKYNPATEITVSGVVDDVVQNQGKRGRTGIHVMVKSGSDVLTVHLGPSEFLGNSKFSVAKGDKIEVVGSKVQLGGNNVVIAREVKKADQVLTLRDAQGLPKWRGAGKGPRS